ncbi:MAG: ATP-binding protein [Lachnospiraceae bacterium]|nr:ATP-binding protein [Lachnospiraceae bacterium]
MDILNLDKWNKKLFNLCWLYVIIATITSTVTFFILYFLNPVIFYPVPIFTYILYYIILPSLLMVIVTILCKVSVLYAGKSHDNLKPYLIIFTCIIHCNLLLLVHYGIPFMLAAYFVPLICALIYNNKKVLVFAYLGSMCALLLVYFSLLYNFWSFIPRPEAFRVGMDRGDMIATLSLLSAAYFIFRIILNRYSEIIELLIAKERVEAKIEMRAQFLAKMSHEIRTPLNGVIGYAEILLGSENLTESVREQVNKIKYSADGILEITNEILDIAKNESGNVKLENIPFDLKHVLTVCEFTIEAKAKEKNLMLNFDTGDLPERNLLGDPARLRQILINLLSNAIKFTENGKVSLEVEVLEENDETVKVLFAVRDTGIGLSSEQIKYIFEPFWQAGLGTTRQYGGTGLGLVLAKDFVAMMGGNLNVESLPGQGSKFSFVVAFQIAPLALEEAGKQLSSIDKQSFSGDILVCEDNKTNQEVISVHLTTAGLDFIIAENGKIGVDYVKQRMETGKPFDIIFMDIQMPVMNGLEAAGEIINLGVKTPIIALTANVMPEDRIKYLEVGMKDYLLKPFKQRDLCIFLRKYLVNEVIDINLGLINSANNEALQKKLLLKFQNNHQEHYGQIEKAAINIDNETGRRLTHTQKNAALLIGATKLSEALEKLEKEFAGGLNEYPKKLMETYRNELDKVVKYIKDIGL